MVGTPAFALRSFGGLSPPGTEQILDLRAASYYLRAMLSVCAMTLSRVRRGRTAGPGALRMR
jgi:hypothetical protein